MRIPRVCSLLLLVACAHGGAPEVTPAADASAPRVDGAPTPREAVLVFLTAAGSRDERTLASVWGSTAGPARTRYAAKELHGYAVSLACVFANELTSWSSASGIRASIATPAITRPAP